MSNDFQYSTWMAWGPSPDPRIGDGEWATIGRRLRDKVQAILKADISTEEHVVHFIVALRKLMEHANTGAPALKFFCDWALHPRISRRPSEILIRMNHALEHGDTVQVIGDTIGRTLSMDTFRDDLLHELMRFALPTDAIGKLQPWLQFLRLYFRTIANAPVLSCNPPLTQVDRLAVQLSDNPPHDLPIGAAFAFTINWTFIKERDIVFEWNNELIYPPEYQPGTFYQIHPTR